MDLAPDTFVFAISKSHRIMDAPRTIFSGNYSVCCRPRVPKWTTFGTKNRLRALVPKHNRPSERLPRCPARLFHHSPTPPSQLHARLDPTLPTLRTASIFKSR